MTWFFLGLVVGLVVGVVLTLAILWLGNTAIEQAERAESGEH